MRVILPLILFLLLCQPLFALDEPPTDLTAAGQTTDNKREGKWTFSDATGRNRFEIDYVRGLRTGAYIQWNEDGKLIVLSERGELHLAPLDPKAWSPISSFSLFSGKAWTVPTLAHGVLYARDTTTLVALEVAQ